METLHEDLDSVEAFNPALGCWEAVPSMSIPRANAGAVASEGFTAAIN